MTIWTLLELLILLGCSALFSGGETALFSLNAVQTQQFARKHSSVGRMARSLVRRPEQLLVTVLLGNMTVNILFFAVSSVAVVQIARDAGRLIGTAAALVPLVSVVVFGEVLPKATALAFPVAVSLLVAAPLYVLDRVLMPIRVVLQKLLVNPAVRLVAPEANDDRAITHEELQTLLQASTQRGALDVSTSVLLQEVVELRDMRVSEVMIPRADLIAFDLDEPREALIELVRGRKLRLVPAYRNDFDHIVGLIPVRDLFLYQGRSLDELVVPALYVPELATLDHLLSTFRERGERVAIAVDEYGGTAGLVTLRDVVAEIVGELHDPRDEPEEEIQQLGPDEFLLPGSLSVRDWGELFRLRVATRGVDTVAGLVIAKLGRLPHVNESVRVRNLVLTVDQMKGRRVSHIRLRRLDESKFGGSAGAAS